MSLKKCHLAYALSTLAIGAALVLAAPVGAENSTTIDQSTQPHLKSWSNKIPSAKRFVVLADFNNEAVLDRETGLVWEQTPDADIMNWFVAAQGCANKSVGGRKGWRLPSVVELSSLIDPSLLPPFVPIAPSVPAIFTGVQLADYWSATIFAGQPPPAAWRVYFDDGRVGITGSSIAGRAWCVRGPMNADTY